MYSAQPSMLTLLKANRARASETPFSTTDANCSSWPGRPSCTVSVQEAASKVKSSKDCIAWLPPPPAEAVGHPQGQHELPHLAGVADQAGPSHGPGGEGRAVRALRP